MDLSFSPSTNLLPILAPGTRAGRFLLDPQVSPADRRKVLEGALRDKVTPGVRVFADLLLRKKRLGSIASVAHEFQAIVERVKGLERNPYRAGFLQLVAVSETDAQAEADYAKHVEYFYHKCLHVPPQWFAPPGNQDYRSLLAANRNPVRRAEDPKTLRYKDFVDKGYVIAGSPATVKERLIEEVIKRLNVGNLMVLVQIGSMPHELTLKNIDLFAREVLPGLREIWDDKGWENHWWPKSLRGSRQPAGAAR